MIIEKYGTAAANAAAVLPKLSVDFCVWMQYNLTESENSPLKIKARIAHFRLV